MAVKTAQYIFNGQAYNLTYNSTSGKWEAIHTIIRYLIPEQRSR